MVLPDLAFRRVRAQLEAGNLVSTAFGARSGYSVTVTVAVMKGCMVHQ